MPSKFDRFFNPKDGTYANVPIVPVHIEHFRGKRFFNNDVLIGNWYEDRSKFKESTHKPRTHFEIEYPSTAPDLVVRRRLIIGSDNRPVRKLLDHHDIDDRKQMISSYDEHYFRRGPYGKNQHTDQRTWAILEKSWLPERSDHPLEDEPTRWGLVQSKRSQSQMTKRERTMPSVSEYGGRYVRHRPTSRLIGIPRIFSTSMERPAPISNETLARSESIIGDAEPMEIDHLCSVRRNTSVPRSYFYLGRQPSVLPFTSSSPMDENSNSPGENVLRI